MFSKSPTKTHKLYIYSGGFKKFLQTLQSHFHVGKMLNDYFKLGSFFFKNVLQFELQFWLFTLFFTAMFMPLFYERLEICMENGSFALPTYCKAQLWNGSFRFFSASSLLACLFLDAFTSASRHCHFHRRRPLGHSFRVLVARRSLSFNHFYWVVYFTFLSPSLSLFVVPPSSSYSFTSASRRRRRPLDWLLKLLVAKVYFSSSQEFPRRAIKAAMSHQGELINLFQHCTMIAARPPAKVPPKKHPLKLLLQKKNPLKVWRHKSMLKLRCLK